MPERYLASSLPDDQLAEFHRLMNEEIKEVAVFFMNTDGIITVWNRAAEEMKGYNAEEAIGQHLEILYTHEDRKRGWAQHNLRKAREEGFYREETWRRRKDGTLFWARIALTGLRDHSGTLIGFSKVTVDLTDHKMLESCVKEREETRRVLRAAHAGLWSWCPDTDRVEVCANFLGLLGYPSRDTAMTLDEWLPFVDDEDRPRVVAALEHSRDRRPGEPFSMDLRLCQRDRTCRWFHMHADWHRDGDTAPYVLSGVCVDVDELKSTGRQLESAVEKLRLEDARKDEFLAMLAHELRNPLAPIRSAAELLKIARLDDGRVRKTSDIIARQVDHMTSLVDDLLDVSRVTRGLVQLEMAPVDFDQAVADAVEQVGPLIRGRQHQLDLQMAPGPVSVRGDKKRLVQIIANLLNNAAKFTREGGRILLKTEVRGGSIVLSVIDNGIGMPPDLVEHAFDLFVQAKRTPDRSTGGLGLGLALVKSLTELHDGEVRVASDGLGGGSTFEVSLPMLAVAPAPVESGAASHRTAARRRPVRVLVVDDNVDAAQMLAMFLEELGHQVAVEHAAISALERSRRQDFDVCLLDIGLPDIDGNELARRLRAEPETAHLMLIAITGYGQESDRDSALKAGFNHHLVKPVDPAKLAPLLDAIAAL
ncbi:Histidine kinase [Burkholderiales bacterium 8X]|nr:Histidine kinase [Burkholderiales bacterium 8X]